ncbi:MAG: hypothetical protein DMD26_04420, partial [Gemmatimonadetes bacterium]
MPLVERGRRHLLTPIGALACAALVLPALLRAQNVTQSGDVATPAARAAVPFAAGERLEYDVKFG